MTTPAATRAAEITANCKRNARIRTRANEIVSKHTPDLTGSANALRNPGDFIERCQYRAERNRLLRMAGKELECLDYALEYWQHDFDVALAELTRPARKPLTLAEQVTRRQAIVDQMAARRAAFEAARGGCAAPVREMAA